jgi:hypothetical protein
MWEWLLGAVFRRWGGIGLTTIGNCLLEVIFSVPRAGSLGLADPVETGPPALFPEATGGLTAEVARGRTAGVAFVAEAAAGLTATGAFPLTELTTTWLAVGGLVAIAGPGLTETTDGLIRAPDPPGTALGRDVPG